MFFEKFLKNNGSGVFLPEPLLILIQLSQVSDLLSFCS